MKMLSKEVFDEYGKKRLKEIIEKGASDVTVCAGFIDIFGDARIIACNKCGVPCLVRPWLFKAIIEHYWKVICICCADPQDVKGQIVIDLSKIEIELKKRY